VKLIRSLPVWNSLHEPAVGRDTFRQHLKT